MPCNTIRLEVIGNPAPAGSKSFKGFSRDGKAILAESCQDVKPWRETVMWACREQARDQHIAGAVKVEMIFTLYKPVEARKRKRTRPSTPPDLSKLARSTEDALTLARVWEDDARVVEYLRLAKVYPNEDPDALSVPGAVIRIHRLTAVEPEQPVLEFAVRKGAQPELQLSGNR